MIVLITTQIVQISKSKQCLIFSYTRFVLQNKSDIPFPA